MRRTRAPQNVSAAADWAAAVRSRAATKGWTIEELYRQLEKFTPEEVRQTRDWPKGSTFRSWLRLDHPVPPNPTIARRVADLVGLDPSFSVALTASAEQANATAEVLRVAATQSEIARQLSAAHSQALDTVLSARPSAAVAARVAAHYSGRQDADGTTYACEIRPLARGIKHREIYHDAVLFTPLDDHGAPVDCAHLREHTPDAAGE